MKFIFEKKARKYLKKCDKKLKNRLFEEIYKLEKDPFPSGKKFKKMINTSPPKFRLRVGEYRLFYFVDFDSNTVLIRDIFHGHDGY